MQLLVTLGKKETSKPVFYPLSSRIVPKDDIIKIRTSMIVFTPGLTHSNFRPKKQNLKDSL